jgi:hypothetical protein
MKLEDPLTIPPLSKLEMDQQLKTQLNAYTYHQTRLRPSKPYKYRRNNFSCRQ